MSRNTRKMQPIRNPLSDPSADDTPKLIIYKGNKGEERTINLPDLKEKLTLLRNNASTIIINVSGELASVLNELIRLVRTTHGTPNYEAVYEIITEVFSATPTKLIPGSIGAYFWGCSAKTSGKLEPSCNALCAGSVPPPNKGWTFCEYQCLLYQADEKVIALNETQNSDMAYLYVADGAKFPGLSSKNVADIKSRYKTTKVKLIHYSESGMDYKIDEDFVNIDSIVNDKSSSITSSFSSYLTTKNLIIAGAALVILYVLLRKPSKKDE